MDGWFETALPDDIERAIQYLNLTKEEGMNWGMMRGIWSSVADLAVVQAQDVLGLGHEARMNTPATLGGNWCWRALPGAFTPELAQKLHDAMELYGRPPPEQLPVRGLFLQIFGLLPWQQTAPMRVGILKALCRVC